MKSLAIKQRRQIEIVMVAQTGDERLMKTAEIASADADLARPRQAQQAQAKQFWTWLRRIEVH